MKELICYCTNTKYSGVLSFLYLFCTYQKLFLHYQAIVKFAYFLILWYNDCGERNYEN